MPLAVLCLGLLDQLLLAPVLALSLGLLRSGVQGCLMPETVDHAGGEGGITQNLKTSHIRSALERARRETQDSMAKIPCTHIDALRSHYCRG